jgi:hypothetical protein
MSQNLNSAVAVIGIDINKNSFHIVGLDVRGAIALRQKWSRGQVEARLANMPPCLTGMEDGPDSRSARQSGVQPSWWTNALRPTPDFFNTISQKRSRSGQPPLPTQAGKIGAWGCGIVTPLCTCGSLGALMSQSIQKKMCMLHYSDHDRTSDCANLAAK